MNFQVRKWTGFSQVNENLKYCDIEDIEEENKNMSKEQFKS